MPLEYWKVIMGANSVLSKSIEINCERRTEFFFFPRKKMNLVKAAGRIQWEVNGMTDQQRMQC